ncbi:MAG TPA: hypothetical protein VFC78_07035 [Tepidisphaeraceae bacterium]|nr:hypothetical protein [Tepidisphaeraceae bacterium]
MATLEQLAQAALGGEALALRGLAQDWLAENPNFACVPRPRSNDPMVLAVAAALVEMFADRRGETGPDWAIAITQAPEPVYLLREAARMRRLRELCRDHAPPALRRRGIYAPPDFLVFV